MVCRVCACKWNSGCVCVHATLVEDRSMTAAVLLKYASSR